jgi:hypothetical protein
VRLVNGGGDVILQEVLLEAHRGRLSNLLLGKEGEQTQDERTKRRLEGMCFEKIDLLVNQHRHVDLHGL